MIIDEAFDKKERWRRRRFWFVADSRAIGSTITRCFGGFEYQIPKPDGEGCWRIFISEHDLKFMTRPKRAWIRKS